MMPKRIKDVKPFRNRLFYLDISSSNLVLKNKLKYCIKHLGGTIDEWLDKKVRYVVTDRPQKDWPNINKKHEKLDCLKTNDNLLDVISLTRGKRLATKAPTQTPIKTNNVLDTAIKINMKILTYKSILDFCKQYMKIPQEDTENESLNKSSKTVTPSTSNSSSVKIKMLKKPFIKVEDIDQKFSPIVKEFEKWPFIDLNSTPGFSPFENIYLKTEKVVKTLTPQTPLSFNTNKTFELTSKQNTTNTQQNQTLKNLNTSKIINPHKKRQRVLFCEICSQEFSNLHEHLKYEQHQKYMNNEENYKELKLVIDSLPKCSFLNHSSLKENLDEFTDDEEINSDEENNKEEINSDEEDDEEEINFEEEEDDYDEDENEDSDDEEDEENGDCYEESEEDFGEKKPSRFKVIYCLNSDVTKNSEKGRFLPLHNYVNNKKINKIKKDIYKRIKVQNDVLLENDSLSENKYVIEDENCEVIPPSYSTPVKLFKLKNVFADITNEEVSIKSDEF